MNLVTILLNIEPDTRWITVNTGEELLLLILLGFLLMAGALILAIVLHLYLTFRQLTANTVTPKPGIEPQTFWQRFIGLSPLKMEKDLVMEHQYDGIQELDNPTPPWFMSLFYGTIAIGVIYMLVYHVFDDGDIMVQEYTQEVVLAEKQREVYLSKVAGSINENTVTRVSDGQAIEAGKSLFTQHCTACHGQNAEGKVGPNLTDEYWLHGGSIKDVFHIISEGVPEKGMVPWKKQLNPLQIQQVASYILSLQGTNPSDAKEPQGDKVAAEAVAVNE